MSLVIGIATQHSIVMAADSAESVGYPGFFKGSVQKIVPFSHIHIGAMNSQPQGSPGDCAIGGSGDSGYIEAATSELGMAFLGNPSITGDHLKSCLGKTLWKFYRDHIIPFSKFPNEERPSLELIIGAQRKAQLYLYVTEKNTLRVGWPYCAVGCGAAFAKNLLANLYKALTTKEAQALAVYVLLMSKSLIEGVGAATSVVTLNGWEIQNSNQGSTLVPPKHALTHMSIMEVTELEKQFVTELMPKEREHFWNFVHTLP